VFSAAKAAQATFSDRFRQRVAAFGIRLIDIYPPNFANTSLLDRDEWHHRRQLGADVLPSARNVLDAIVFALLQDRICSIDSVVLSNSQTDLL
jgi:NADP-dependent 3-hydroxy acid dehydrogenase YdfG